MKMQYVPYVEQKLRILLASRRTTIASVLLIAMPIDPLIHSLRAIRWQVR